MKRLIILTDEDGSFLVSRADFKNFTSMDVEKIRDYFSAKGFEVQVIKFSAFDLTANYKGIYILYQTSEAEGSFYKRYIEDVIFLLQKQGAITLPVYEYLKAHHDKVFMEMLRMRFRDEALKSISTYCYGSWIDAHNYDGAFPVVVKNISTTSGLGVYLARDRGDYLKKAKKAGKVILAKDIFDFVVLKIKNLVKNLLKFLFPARSDYVRYDTTPLSSPIIVQTFIQGLSGDYKVLIFGKKYYCMYRKNRANDFRASGSENFNEVPDEEMRGLLDFARKLTFEIDFPIFGIDIGFDGISYHLIEFQMIHIGTSALQRSNFWHEYHDGNWIKFDGKSDLEEEFSRAVYEFIIGS